MAPSFAACELSLELSVWVCIPECSDPSDCQDSYHDYLTKGKKW